MISPYVNTEHNRDDIIATIGVDCARISSRVINPVFLAHLDLNESF